jgi:ornithine cyclodeaminase/alanine dehydrogenase-like protein (mu-crystallin family)
VLGRDARPRRLLAVGAGAQIEAHASLLIQLYPSIDSVSVLNRTANSRAEGTLSSLRTRFPSVNFAFATLGDDLRPHVETADILVMATSSTMPLLGDAEQFVRKGAHIILVGSYTPAMHEISGALLARTRTSSSGPRALLVDSRAACLKEAGELITAGLAPSDVVEIGELLHLDGDMGYTVDPERSAALRGSSEVSIFKSVGVGVQDVAIAAYIVEKAEEMGLGVQVADYDL